MANEIMTGNNSRTERIDINLLDMVNEALYHLSFIRQSGLHLQIKVLAKVVTMSGFVPSYNMRRMVLQAVAQVQGVKSVVDSLYTDRDLAIDVSQLLKLDPITEHAHNIRVTSNQGHVTLTGKVATIEIIEAAGQLPFRVPGVKGVINHLSLFAISLMDIKRLSGKYS
jgi:osmotically-inducible protein OsmY